MSLFTNSRMFADVPLKWLDDLERGSVALQFDNGAQIFAEGDPAVAVYVITGGEGRVRIGSIDPRGKAIMVEVLGVGETFGEIAVIDGGPRTAGRRSSASVAHTSIAFLGAASHNPEFQRERMQIARDQVAAYVRPVRRCKF